jgi:predicted kinase
MKTFLNIRGANGSGKSTLARAFFGENDATVDLAHYKTKSGRDRSVTGRSNPDRNALVVGDYSTMAGGLDKVPNFALQFAAIEAGLLLEDLVVAEGVLASTVYGSWAMHAEKLAAEGVRVIWAFLDTPLEVCLERIQKRNGGKPIKEDLVANKVRSIAKVRLKAIDNPAIVVVDLPYGSPASKLEEIL